MAELSVILPVYRTATAIPELHRRLAETLQGRDFELIFVDDACPEGSAAVLARIADPRVVTVTHAANRGQRQAVLSGLRAARGTTIVIMDADLQDEPEDIPRLLAVLRPGQIEAVFAGRRGDYQAASRMWTSRLFKRLMHRLTGVPADAGSFVAMTRRMAGAVLRLATGQRPYMLALIGATRLPVCSVATRRAVRPAGTSAYSEWRRLRFALSGLRAALELRWNRWPVN